MNRSPILALLAILLCVASALGADPATEPKPIPQTRPAEKVALDALKRRQPRLPLPPPTEEELRQAAERAAAGGVGGGLGGGLVNNGRMRNLHLPAELRGSGGGFTRQKDPQMTLDNTFTVELFWIVSRANNCHYCLGHQEAKLTSAGVSEPRIAALDCDWSKFTPAEQAAYAFTRKLTYQPDSLTNADIEGLLKHYKPLEALEIVFHVARYNSTNRWTDSLGIPQEDHRTFITATPEEFANKVTVVALSQPPQKRELPSRADTLAAVAAAQQRSPRLPLADKEETVKVLELAAGAEPAAWQRLLANFPITGKGQAQSLVLLQEKGAILPLVKAQIDWICARQDRAWYALGQAHKRLQKLGLNDDAIFALDDAEKLPTEQERAAAAFAAKLTAIPQGMTDADVERLKKVYEPGQVAEIVHRICQAAFFDRLTEAAGLAVEK